MPIYHEEQNRYEFTEEDKKNKSNNYSPEGYTWVGNTRKVNSTLTNNLITNDCILQDTAYDVYGNFLTDCYAIYKKLDDEESVGSGNRMADIWDGYWG